MAADSSALDYYKPLLDDNIMKMILVETNRFGAEENQDWVVITRNDLERLVALVMLNNS